MDTETEYTIQDESSKAPALPGISLNWFIFFLIWPFAALVAALKRFREPFAKTIFWFFCVYFGFVFIYADPYKTGNADSARYARRLIEIHENPVGFGSLVNSFYDPSSGVVDIYQPLVTWLVSLITGDPRILFMVFAMVFGYFLTQNLWLIISRINKKIGIASFLVFVGYALVNPIWYINGVRMWTALQVFFYGCLIFLLEEKKKGIVWMLSSIVFHFSFFFPVALFIIYLFLPKKLWIFFLFFAIAGFIKEINMQAVREALSFLPDVFQSRVEGYTSEPVVRSVLEAKQYYAWHVKFAGLAERIFVYLMSFILFINRRKWIDLHTGIFKLFTTGLYIGGFALLASLVPSGARFLSVAYLFLYASFILFFVFVKTNKAFYFLQALSLPFLLFVIVFKIRVGFDYMGVVVFLGNPVIAMFINEQTRLIDFVKQLF